MFYFIHCSYYRYWLNKSTDGKRSWKKIFASAETKECPCVHKTLTLRMRHSRISQTVRKDHKRLAIDTCSIPSLYAVWYWVAKHTERRIKTGKSRIEAGTENISKNNKKEHTYLMPYWCRNLGLIDMEQRLQKPQLRKQHTCAISKQTLLRKLT